MFDNSRRRRPGFGQVDSSSYFDYQEDRVRVMDNEHSAQEALNEPAADGFVVQVADAETSEALQREYFSASRMPEKSTK